MAAPAATDLRRLLGRLSEIKEVVLPGKYPDKIRALPLFDGRFDAHKLSAEGADVLFASYPSGTSIPAHTHDTDNYGVIIRGNLILTMRGRVERYGVGDWYHVPAGVEHAADFDQDSDEIEFWFEQAN